MTTNPFSNCNTIRQINRRYNELHTESPSPELDTAYAEATTDDAVARMVAQGASAARALPGVRVEIIGSWVWVTGKTKPVREQLKAAGFTWHSQRQAWYLPVTISYGRGRKTLDQLRSRYGVIEVSND